VSVDLARVSEASWT